MNNNTKRRTAAARASFSRVKRNRGSELDLQLARTVGHKPALDAFPKVARGKGAH